MMNRTSHVLGIQSWISVLLVFSMGGCGGDEKMASQELGKGKGGTGNPSRQRQGGGWSKDGKGGGDSARVRSGGWSQRRRPGKGDPQGGRWGREGGAAVPVKSEVVRREEISAYIHTNARLEANRWVNVVSQAAGLVIELVGEEGHRVREGQVLARLDKRELALRVQQAEVGLNQARGSFKRAQQLYEREVFSQEEFETARNQMETARVSLEEARLNLAYADIRAPVPGMVMRREIEQGDMVRVNQEVFAVADLNPLYARIHIPEKRIYKVEKDQEARISVDSLPEKTFSGRVRMINPGVDPQSGTVKVTVEIPAEHGLLKPGMFATVRIITERHPRALIIPKKALILETDEDDVFVLDHGTARRTRIELGFTDGERVEVLSGLEEGGRVITVGQEGLKDGAAVRPVGRRQRMDMQ